MKKRAIVFDLDGTLLDTLEDLKNATNAALAHCGMPERSLDEVRSFVGNGIRKLMERAVPDGEKNPKFEVAFAYFKEYYDKHCLDSTKPYPGVMDLLRRLVAEGYPVAIVSNKADFAVQELKQSFFEGVVRVAKGESEKNHKKPAPDMVYAALDELGVERSRAVYVGDSDVDLATARNSQLPCISVTWGFRDRKFLAEHGATQYADSAEELYRMIAQL